MNSLDSLITDLKSTDPATRDRAALEIMDIGDDKAIGPLIDAIRVPENINHRGTLVYALGAFDCIDHLDLLVDLCITGNFEVSSCAYNSIEDFELTTHIAEQIRGHLLKYNLQDLPHEHSSETYAALSQLISEM